MVLNLNQNEIRRQFIDFFKSKNHAYVPGCSLVPAEDPTLLFINSGMAQFKDVFLGLGQPLMKRVVNSQKCIRLSGKHNDLEEVGYDTYHHTFFEMLGNWSFGDYYKKEAIAWAWELLSEVWQLPKDKLYATVYETDDEAFDLWQQVTDLDPKKILRFGKKDNFWEMAETGPCGPCSEIHMDVGVEHCTCEGEKKQKCSLNGGGVNQDCPRYIEIWNLVFIQYNREKDDRLVPLEKVHVDTGMGFERICTILQGKSSNYETDVFKPLVDHLEKCSSKKYLTDPQHSNQLNQIAFRVIVDHIRTIAFSIADGVIPSNEGRGYVIRRVIRRAFRYGRELGLHQPFLSSFIPVLDRNFGDFFKKIREQKDFIAEMIHQEEEMFHHTLNRGLNLFEKITRNPSQTVISGETAFELYDTYGFPLDLTLLLAKEKKLTVDQAQFEELLTRQRNLSKRGKKSIGKWNWASLFKDTYLETIYTGDERFQEQGRLERMIIDGKFREKLSADESGILVFNRTCFYPESGGQIGDQGEISDEEGNLFQVEDCQKIEKIFLVYGKMIRGNFLIGKNYQQRYHKTKRHSIRKNHTATHLLNQVLVETLGDHIRQSGSLVNDQKLRFDFNHASALSRQEKVEIEKKVNCLIQKNLEVSIEEMPMKEALKKNARAFFEEKYGETVRVVSIGDEEDLFSIELCGGSHVRQTAEIGGFKILSESSSSSGVRRIEAITGSEILSDYFTQQSILDEVKNLLQVSQVDQLTEEVKKLKMKLSHLKEKTAQDRGRVLISDLKKNQEIIHCENQAIHFYFLKTDREETRLLTEQLDQLRSQDQQAIILLVNRVDDRKLTLLIGVSQNLIGQYHAGRLIQSVARYCGGKGGGKPTFAQAGGNDVTQLDQAVNELRSQIKKLSSSPTD